jgi:hypothetical protein
VFNLVAASGPTGVGMVSGFVQEEFDFVIVSAEVDGPADVEKIVAAVDGVVDVVFVDGENKPYLERPLAVTAAATAQKSRVLSYKDNDVWARSVDHQVTAMLSDVYGRRATVLGTTNLALKLALSLAERGAAVTLSGDGSDRLDRALQAVSQLAFGKVSVGIEVDAGVACQEAEALLSFWQAPRQITQELVAALAPGAVVVDAVIGSITAEAVAFGIKRGVRVIRPDMRAGLAAELRLALGAHRLVHEFMGRGELAGVAVVAGGLLGRYGDVVLDSWTQPSRAIGIADGQGRVLYDVPAAFAEDIAKVELAIFRKQSLAG